MRCNDSTQETRAAAALSLIGVVGGSILMHPVTRNIKVQALRRV
jgi:hypothetical protein